MVTVFLAQSRARALMVHAGTPVFAEAHAGVFGTPSSSPMTYALTLSKPTVWVSTYSLS